MLKRVTPDNPPVALSAVGDDMRNRVRSLVFGLVMAGVGLPQCWADPVTVSYVGSITQLLDGKCVGFSTYCYSYYDYSVSSSSIFQGVPISLGDTFSGQFTYDSNAPLVSLSPDGQVGTFYGITGNSFSIDGITLPGPLLPYSLIQPSAIVVNNPFNQLVQQNFFQDNSWFAFVGVGLVSPLGSNISATSPPGATAWSQYTNNSLSVSFWNQSVPSSDQLALSGTISSLTVTSVPEPSTCTMIVGGLLLLGWAKHRRGSSRA